MSVHEGQDHPLRRRYSDEALLAIPRLVQMIDRNPYSPTYGSFDRSYWHYRTMDFPCGMYQEFCLPLALAYAGDFPGNPYKGLARMKELAMAGVDYARKSSRSDGTCDDYFPFERALGAMVFSLYACTETALVLSERPAAWLEFFARRADYLRAHNESGQLTNHQALAALALYNVYLLTGEERFRTGSARFVDIVRAWQNWDEGWFQEYEGADPGYHTCTIAFLAKLYRKSGDDSLLEMMDRAVNFAWYFMHPDGSYAGEYGSRNTYHFYPHGFEVMAPRSAKAVQIADLFLEKALPLRTRYFNDDDRMCAHYVYDWMQAWEDFAPVRATTPLTERPPETKWFPQARMVVHITPRYHAVANFSKGGVLKVVTAKGAVYSDTGLIGRTDKGAVLVSHIVDQYEIGAQPDAGVYRVNGRMCERRAKLATPFRQILFRILNLTIGRFHPNLLRSILQKILITGKRRTKYEFAREIAFDETGVTVTTGLRAPEGEAGLESLHIGSDATSIYVANSNVYQRSVLLPWHRLDEMRLAINERGEETCYVRVEVAANGSANVKRVERAE